MRKKYLILAAALCLSMVVFVGCGNKDNNDGNQITSSPSANDAGGDNNNVMDDVENGVNDVIDGTEDAVDDMTGGTNDATGNNDGTDTTNNDRDRNNNSVTSGKKDRNNR